MDTMNFGPGIFPVIFIVVAIFIILIAIASHKRQQDRANAFAQLALRNGWTYLPEAYETKPWEGCNLFAKKAPADPRSYHFLQRFLGFEPFGYGDNRVARNVICYRQDDVDWYAFDYHYSVTTGSGDDQRTSNYDFAVVAARVPVHFPKLDIDGENLFTKIGSAIGFKDVEFEMEEFNRRYRVSCGDRQVAFDFIHPQMIEYLMRLPVRSWQFDGPFVVVHQSRALEEMEMLRVMEDIRGFIALIPDYVRQDRQRQNHAPTPLE